MSAGRDAPLLGLQSTWGLLPASVQAREARALASPPTGVRRKPHLLHTPCLDHGAGQRRGGTRTPGASRLCLPSLALGDRPSEQG